MKTANRMQADDFIAYTAQQRPNDPALLFADESFTYAELNARVQRLANALGDIASPGDRVAILSENRPEYVEAYYGVPRAGMALTFLNYRLHPREIAQILDDSGSRVLLVEQPYYDALKQADCLGPVEQVLLLGDGDASGAPSLYSEFVTSGEGPVRTTGVDPDETAWIIYTSGTTGRPKGAMLSHNNIIASVANSVMAWESAQDSRALMPWPLCHIAGFSVLVTHATGRPLVLMRSYAPKPFLESIQRYGVTDTSVAPTMLGMLLRDPDIDSYDLSTIRRIGYGSAAMPIEILTQAMKRFPGARFQTGFGMTELSGNVLYQPHEAHELALRENPDLLTSVGRPMPLGSVRVVDEELRDAKPGVVGELVIRAPQVTRGYWNRPEATEEAFRGGWFHSGDLARRDENGNFYIVDRMKDMIVTGGENVYSREVEDVIYRHPGVAEAAIVGIPDELWGERVVAVIAPKSGATINPDEVIQLCRDNLASYKKPTDVRFRDEMPKTASGKIMKRVLRDELNTK